MRAFSRTALYTIAVLGVIVVFFSGIHATLRIVDAIITMTSNRSTDVERGAAILVALVSAGAVLSAAAGPAVLVLFLNIEDYLYRIGGGLGRDVPAIRSAIESLAKDAALRGPRH